MRRARQLLGLAVTAVLMTAVAAVATPAHQAPQAHAATPRPIIFVHGFFGSGSQFQAQAKRFASNGYPARYIEAHEYDSLFLNNSPDQVFAALDQRIARLKAATGADKVELVGHSLGTAMSQGYLSTPERAANVAHYVNIDGVGALAPPGGVPSLSIMGQFTQVIGTIIGGTNFSVPNESHVETTASPAGFREMYKFFNNGQNPATTEVLPQSGTIQLAGRAVYFPYNVALKNSRLDVYQIDAGTGQRTGFFPVASYNLPADGSWGPFNASGTASYEFQLSTSTSTERHHIYFQPFRRTDLDVRLLSSEPGGLLAQLIERSPRHSAVLAYRDKEWWADQGVNNDTLTVNGTSILSTQVTPRSKQAIGIFAYDGGSDGVSNPTTSPGILGLLPFITTSDIYLAANAQANGVLRFETKQRGGNGQTARVAVPNWPSDQNVVTVMFDAYP